MSITTFLRRRALRLTIALAATFILIPPGVYAQEAESSEPAPIEPGPVIGVNYSPASPGAISFELNIVTRKGIIGGLEFGGFFNGTDKPTFVDFPAADTNVTILGWHYDPELFLLFNGGWGLENIYATYSVGVSQQPRVFLVQGGDQRVYKNEADVDYRFIHGLDVNVLIGGHFKVSAGYYTRRKWTLGLGAKF